MFPIEKIDSINAYIQRDFAHEPDVLKEYAALAREDKIYPVEVTADVGRLLELLVRAVGAKSVLEIGTLWGYSAWWLYQGLPAYGRLVSLEKHQKHFVFAQRFFASQKMDVDLRHCDALEEITTFEPASFDFVFIDADKAEYPQFLEKVTPVLASGGMLLADNVLYSANWNGQTTADSTDNPRIQAARRFNDALAGSDAWTALPLAIQQGVMIALKK